MRYFLITLFIVFSLLAAYSFYTDGEYAMSFLYASVATLVCLVVIVEQSHKEKS